jgi:hypothetical protein
MRKTREVFPGHSDNSGEHGPVPRVPPDRQGSDAYITHDGLMQAMVSTFNSEDLKIDPNVRKKK